MISKWFDRESDSFRFVDRVEFGRIEVLPRARWEAAFCDVDVQVETAIRSGALSKWEKEDADFQNYSELPIGTHLGDGDIGAEAVHRLKVAVSQLSLGPDEFPFLVEIRFVLPEKRMEIKLEVFPVQVSGLGQSHGRLRADKTMEGVV